MFSAYYGLVHVTSSPHYPQGNGQAERAVQTTKQLLSSGADPALSLLSYRTAAMPWCGYSPAELLMGGGGGGGGGGVGSEHNSQNSRTAYSQLASFRITESTNMNDTKANKRVTMMHVTEHMGEQT